MRASHAAGLLAVVVLGAAAGLGLYTFAYAKGWPDGAAVNFVRLAREQEMDVIQRIFHGA